MWERYAELYPNEDLVYTVGISDYRKDWFFAQVNRCVFFFAFLLPMPIYVFFSYLLLVIELMASTLIKPHLMVHENIYDIIWKIICFHCLNWKHYFKRGLGSALVPIA